MSLARRETAAGCTPEALDLESSPILRAFREHFQPDVDEVLVDLAETYEQARAFMQVVMPENFRKVKLYRDEIPLFSCFLA